MEMNMTDGGLGRAVNDEGTVVDHMNGADGAISGGCVILNLNYEGLKELTPWQIERLQSLSPHHLYLKFNLLKKLPGCINQVSSLTELHIVGNMLETLPPQIGDLWALQVLDVMGNRLQSLPAAIGQLESLRKLQVSNNRLQELPTDIASCQELRTLELSTNLLVELPIELGQCSNLDLLAVDKNKLQTVPRHVCGLKKLTELSLCGNQLQYLPHGLGCMAALQSLYVDNNPGLTTLPLSLHNHPSRTVSCFGYHSAEVQNETGHQLIEKKSGTTVELPRELETMCGIDSANIPILKELAFRKISSVLNNIQDSQSTCMQLPQQLESQLMYPTAWCETCHLPVFVSAFPVVLKFDMASLFFSALCCSRACMDSLTEFHKAAVCDIVSGKL